jgi:imidazole glycerol phosphate synthase subunit HisF
MALKARVIPCLDVMDGPRRPQPHGGEDAQTKKEAVR